MGVPTRPQVLEALVQQRLRPKGVQRQLLHQAQGRWSVRPCIRLRPWTRPSLVLVLLSMQAAGGRRDNVQICVTHPSIYPPSPRGCLFLLVSNLCGMLCILSFCAL
jgi:hypothetical protein